MSELKLVITHYKILDLVETLNKQNLYPNQEGVFKIVSGLVDEETEEYQNLNTFGVLRSYSSKKICRFILALLRHGYLEKKYDPKTDELYLKITTLGSLTLAKYLKKRKTPYAKTKGEKPVTIVTIK